MRSSRILRVVLSFIFVWSEELSAEAFVASSSQLSKIIATGNRCNKGRRAEEPTARAKAGAYGLNEVRRWRTLNGVRQRRMGGLRNLRAGLDFQPLPISELIEGVGREIAEQSVKRHWQSGFIGGSVGVMGTLVAIQVQTLILHVHPKNTIYIQLGVLEGS